MTNIIIKPAAVTSLPDHTNAENDVMGQHEVLSNRATTDDFDDSWLRRNDCFEITSMDIMSNGSAMGLSRIEHEKEKARERSVKWYHMTTAEQKAERNAKKRANRSSNIGETGAIVSSNKDTIDGICVTPFGTAVSGVDDEITPEELKREGEKKIS